MVSRPIKYKVSAAQQFDSSPVFDVLELKVFWNTVNNIRQNIFSGQASTLPSPKISENNFIKKNDLTYKINSSHETCKQNI
jgi:hypothetical protein